MSSVVNCIFWLNDFSNAGIVIDSIFYMEISLLTSEIISAESRFSLGNEQINQSQYLKGDFISILTNLINHDLKKAQKENKLLSQTSMGVDNFSDISSDSSKRLNEKIEIGEEQQKTINAVIHALLDTLNLMTNNIENNHEFNQEMKETIPDLLSVNSSLDLEENSILWQVKKDAESISTQKPDLLIFSDAKGGVLDIETTIKALFEDAKAISIQKQEILVNSESRGGNLDIEKIINNLPEKNINQVIPRINNDDLNKNMKTNLKLDTIEPLNKDNNLLSINTLNHSVAKGTDILKYSFNEHPRQSENNPHEMKYPSKEILFPHSAQTFNESIDKNLHIESTQPKIKLVNHEVQDINETRIYFSKVDNSTVRLEIKPEGMGLCDIELIFEKGVLNAQILASESAGKNFFDNNLTNIINNLLKEGINIGKFSVSLGDKKGYTKDEKEGESQKASKLIHEISLLNNHYKDSLISIFV